VNAPGALALSSSGERLLQVVARAGGPKFEAIESYVTLQRDGRRAKVLLSRIVQDPSENIFVRARDVVFITRESPTFTALAQLPHFSKQSTFISIR
jgi:polysaccharide biosynthesis/export protein